MTASPLPVTFYDRSVIDVARDLLGCHLVHQHPAGRVSGRIVETEAYLADGDSASHAFKGPNRKNASMFGLPGRAYVYSIHARYCFNAVVLGEGIGSAVLVRAVEPIEGIKLMQQRRSRHPLLDLTRGPARLCEAFQITRELDGHDLASADRLWIEPGHYAGLTDSEVIVTRRIGVTSAQEKMLRFAIEGNRFVSGPRSWR